MQPPVPSPSVNPVIECVASGNRRRSGVDGVGRAVQASVAFVKCFGLTRLLRSYSAASKGACPRLPAPPPRQCACSGGHRRRSARGGALANRDERSV